MRNDDTQFLILAIGIVVSVIAWVLSARKYRGVKADLVRLAITAFLTAGFFAHGIHVVYWTLLFDAKLWPGAMILIPMYWLIYVCIYYFSIGALSWVAAMKREREASLQRMRERIGDEKHEK